MADTRFNAALDGIEKAFDVQGGLQGLEFLRSESGIYLHAEVSDYLSRYQTYMINTVSTVTSSGAGTSTMDAPATPGLRYGRYLAAVAMGGTALANITSWVLSIGNTGIQPDYPSSGIFQTPIMAGLARIALGTILIPEAKYTNFPLWCPPGSFIRGAILTSGAAGDLFLQCSWLTTEQLNPAGTAAIGQQRAPIKK